MRKTTQFTMAALGALALISATNSFAARPGQANYELQVLEQADEDIGFFPWESTPLGVENIALNRGSEIINAEHLPASTGIA